MLMYVGTRRPSRHPQEHSSGHDSQRMGQHRHEAQSYDVRRDPRQVQRYRVEATRFPHASLAIFIEAKSVERHTFDAV